MSMWHDVSKELPIEGQKVVAEIEGEEVYKVCKYENGVWYHKTRNGWRAVNWPVTAWRYIDGSL